MESLYTNAISGQQPVNEQSHIYHPKTGKMERIEGSNDHESEMMERGGDDVDNQREGGEITVIESHSL